MNCSVTPSCGASWEGFALEHLLAIHPTADATFYRTAVGEEVDLVLSAGNDRQCIEFKLSSAPVLTRGFWQSMSDLQISAAQVVVPSTGRYPIAANVEVVGLCELAAELAMNLL